MSTTEASPADEVSPPRRVSPISAGLLIVVGAVVAVVGTFLPYEKLETGIGSYAFTGVGAETVTGVIPKSAFMPSNTGLAVLVVGALTVLLGLLVVVRRGWLWVSAATFVLSGIGLAVSIVAIMAASSDARKFGIARNIDIVGTTGIGAVLGAVGTGVALVASVVAFVVRRPQS